MAAPSINASGNVGSPGGLTPLGRIVNVLTLGAAAHPHEAGQYWTGQAKSLNPTTPTGLLNMLGILIPGGRGGRPTVGQQGLLDSIKGSSHQEDVPIYQAGASPALDRSANVLAEAIGAPEWRTNQGAGLTMPDNPFRTLFQDATPFDSGIQRNAPGSVAGVFPDTNAWATDQAPRFGTPAAVNSQMAHLSAVLKILGKNAIARRN